MALAFNSMKAVSLATRAGSIGLFTGSILAAFTAFSQNVPNHDFAWVEKRVAELQVKSQERRFDEIGWAANIREALRLARESNRPVFLFTHDGRMNLGRC